MTEPSDLIRCTTCDQLFDPAYLDEVIYHETGACTNPNAERPKTGIIGTKIDEPPQG